MTGNNNSTNTNVAQGVANSDNYVGVNVLEFFKQNGITIGDDGRLQVTNPTPNNNLFSNMKQAKEWNNYNRNAQREDTDYTVNRGMEVARQAARLTQPHELEIARISQSGSLANANAQAENARVQADIARINSEAELEKLRLENQFATEKENKENSRRTTTFKTIVDDNSVTGIKNRLYQDATRKLELARTRIDNENERNKQANTMEQLNALYRNNLEVGILEGQQKQAELDKQGDIQMSLANADRLQRGYDNQYAMLNEYTNRPRSNFAYWG